MSDREMSDPVTIDGLDLAVVASAGNVQLLSAEIDRCLDTLARLEGEAKGIRLLAHMGLEPPDAEAQLASIGRRHEAATARLAAVRDALRTSTGSRSS